MNNTRQFFSQLSELMNDKNEKIAKPAIELHKELVETQTLETYYQKVEKEAKKFVKKYFDEWVKDNRSWGLESKDKNDIGIAIIEEAKKEDEKRDIDTDLID